MDMCVYVCRYNVHGENMYICVCVRAEGEGTCNVEVVDVYVGRLHIYVKEYLGENLKCLSSGAFRPCQVG